MLRWRLGEQSPLGMLFDVVVVAERYVEDWEGVEGVMVNAGARPRGECCMPPHDRLDLAACCSPGHRTM